MRTVLFLGLALVASIMILAGNISGADYALEKNPIVMKAPLQSIADKRLKVVEPAPNIREAQSYYLLGNLENVRGTVATDAGEQETTFQGEVGFKVISDSKGEKTFVLESLSLVSPGIMTEKGNSGVIGVNLVDTGSKASYDRKTGKVVADVKMTLHYELIDELKGFIREQSEECAVFNSYTEGMAGKIELQLPVEFRMADQGELEANGVVRMELEKPVVGLIKNMYATIDLSKLWWYITKPSLLLKVQPVYIGTGPADPAATGTVLNTLLNGAVSIWDRCGTVRCITLRANQPIYINNDAYKVLTSADVDPAEVNALRATVNVPDALEVFVVNRWDPLFDGGGATWSSGTASAKIVTCDQQMNVPCPPPCGSGSCGPVNNYHLGHELGHGLNLGHPSSPGGLIAGTVGSIMEPSGFCADNPNLQSARNCRSATNPILYWGRATCTKSPDIMD